MKLPLFSDPVTIIGCFNNQLLSILEPWFLCHTLELFCMFLNYDCHHYMHFCSSVYVSARLQAVLTSLLLLMSWHSMTNCQLTCQGPIWGFQLLVRVKRTRFTTLMHSKGWLVSQSVCQSVSGHKNEQFEQISSLFLHRISDNYKYILYVTYLTNNSHTKICEQNHTTKYLICTSQTTVVRRYVKSKLFWSLPKLLVNKTTPRFQY